MGRMPRFLFTLIGIVCLLGLPLFVLPALGGSVFLSPDETANAVAGRHLAMTGTVRIEDDILKMFSWIHPRSFATQDATFLPVGFLGMPILVAGLWKLFGDTGIVFFAPLLVVSVLFPLWRLARPWGRWGQVGTWVGWMTFPTVILYANRGLFPNVAVVCLAVWAAWLVWAFRKRTAFVVAGILAGIALVIRPPEAVWIFPWLGMSWLAGSGSSLASKEKIKNVVWFFIPFLIIAIGGALFAWKMYGTPFMTGYQLRDPITATSTTAVTSADRHVSLFASWPFGFHPRNVWFNVKSYLVVYLFPWFLLVVVAGAMAWKEKRNRAWIWLGVWTAAVLSLIYGQGLYQDNIQNEISIGNSFLRYMLPLSVIAAFSIGWIAKRVAAEVPRFGRVAAVVLFVGIAVCGWWTAFNRDSEGILLDRQELLRYQAIRNEVVSMVPDGTVFLSDRSDKIFFPLFRSVSPMPSRSQITALLANRVAVAVFIRTADAATLQSWSDDGIALQPLVTSGNETVYRAERL